MSPGETGPSPQEMGIETDELKPFEVRQAPDGQFEAKLPSASMDIGEGKRGIVSTTVEKFGTEEEANAAVKEAEKGFE